MKRFYSIVAATPSTNQGGSNAPEVKPANFLYVSKSGNDSTGDGSANLPYLTVGKAIAVATAGTTVLIYPGSYTESITFKPGVHLASPVEWCVTITGNHVFNVAGTVVVEKIVLSNSSAAGSGTTLSFAGTGIQNLQLYSSHVQSMAASGNGDAINWTNTNAGSKIQILDGNISVAHSSATARAFYSTTGAAGTMMANRSTISVDAPNNVCISLGGAINFYHTTDSVIGQMVISGSAALTSSGVSHSTTSVPTLVTTSSGMSSYLNCMEVTAANPCVSGAGGFAYGAISFASTGATLAATLNGGAGAIALSMEAFKIRAEPLKAVPQDGLFEYDGTHLYFTKGATRSQVT